LDFELMGKKLYCGNLSYSITAAQLESMFAEHGNVVSAQVIQDRDTGRPKGFGFVEMSTDQEAASAIDGLNGQEIDGRSIQVNEARPRESRPGGFGGGGGGGGPRGGGGGSRGGGGGSRGGGGGERRERW
jgi:RNA recognition motif-containing protein